MYFHSEASRSFPSSVRAPQTTRPAAGIARRQLTPNGLSWPFSASVSGTLRAGTPTEARFEAGGRFPDPALGVGSGHDPGDRAAGGEFLELIIVQRIRLEQRREIKRGVIGRREAVLESGRASPSALP